MNRKLIVAIATAVILVAGTYIAIQFAKGYRPDLRKREIRGTGLLVTNSVPICAQVFLNGKLTTATNDTTNLPPGEYEVEIKKDGYISWKKTLKIEEELVTQAIARLFPSVTDLRPLTFTGAENLTPSPDGQKIAYVVTASSEDVKKGVWVLDMVTRPFSLSKDPIQIVRNTENLDFGNATLLWSPDSAQLLAHFPEGEKTVVSETNILLDAGGLNREEALRDATARLPVIFSQWEEQLAHKLNDQLLTLPSEMQNIATGSATNLYFSPDEEKLLLTATNEAEIPEKLIPPLPASSTQQEQRLLEPGNVYVYDLKEDRNFLIAQRQEPPAELGTLRQKILLVDRITQNLPFIEEASPSAYTKLQKETTQSTISEFAAQYAPISAGQLQWFPDSNHLIQTEEDKITILEYDGTNRAAVYAGSLLDRFAYSWPDGSKLLILTNLNPQSELPANLYAINLK